MRKRPQFSLFLLVENLSETCRNLSKTCRKPLKTCFFVSKLVSPCGVGERVVLLLSDLQKRIRKERSTPNVQPTIKPKNSNDMTHDFIGTLEYISPLREGESIQGHYRAIDAVLAEPQSDNASEYPNRICIHAKGPVVDQLQALALVPYDERRQLFRAAVRFGVKQVSGKNGTTFACTEAFCDHLEPA